MGPPPILQALHNIALKAGARALELRRMGALDERRKSDGSQVSRADLEAHEVIMASLATGFPGVPVISEEAPIPSWDIRQKWLRHFLVDPLDGSKGFIKGEDEFTVNIALMEGDLVVSAVLHHPPSGISYLASRGQGAWCGDRLMARRSAFPSPLRAIDSRYHSSPRVESTLKSMGIVETLRCSSALKHCRMAEGAAEVYVSFKGTWAWDTAAAQLLLEECGLRMVELETGNDLVHHREDLLNPPLMVRP
ncbi:MAG: 3'(2'),5'-bisphosphate nucleotidase CysQ [Planctomycetota bacterium]